MGKLFVVGVGGTGIKTLIQVKKALTDHARDGKLPANVKLLGIDTCIKAETIADIGSWGGAFARNDSTLNVELDKNEYVALTGDLRDWVNGPEPVTAQPQYGWFNRRYFSIPSNNVLLDISSGAGMYRQVGRLAFFNQAKNENSPLCASIRQGLSELAGNGDVVNVLVCGSLAGGTGAGIFADVGSLIRKIFEAEIRANGATEKLHGLFALPNAFNATGGVSARVKDMKPRTFGALLEIERFLMIKNKEGGSLAQYIERTNDPVQSGRLGKDGLLYDMIWLFDERWQGNIPDEEFVPLDAPIEYGIAPSLANFITLMQDDEFSEHMVTHLANRMHTINNKAKASLGVPDPYVATFGTYSVELPLSSVVESWACRISREVIEKLVPLGSDGKLRSDRAGGKEGEKSGSQQFKEKPEEWGGFNSRMVEDAGKLGMQYDPHNATTSGGRKASILNRKHAREWDAYAPNHADGDEGGKWDALWESYFYHEKNKLTGALVQPVSKNSYSGSAEKAVRVLIENCDGREKQLLQEGKEVLQRDFERQLAAFCAALRLKVEETLNGNNDPEWKNAIENKAGKLGWMLDYLQEMLDGFEGMETLLEEVIQSRGKEIRGLESELGLGGTMGVVGSNAEQMMRKESKQREYLEGRQKLYELRRWELLAKAEGQYVGVFKRYARGMYDELDAYARAIRTDNRGNMLKAIDEQQRNVRAILRAAQEKLGKVKEIIDLEGDRDSKEWEEGQYQRFTEDPQNGSMVERMLKDVEWEVGSGKQKKVEMEDPLTGEKVPITMDEAEIGLEINGYDLPKVGILSTNRIQTCNGEKRNEEVKQIARDNALRMRERCMCDLVQVWDEISVLDYLTEIYGKGHSNLTQEDFAGKLIKRGNVLLRFKDIPDSRAVTYLCGPQAKDETETSWRDLVSESLKTKMGAEESISGYIEVANNSCMYFFSMLDMVNIHDIREYEEGKQEYCKLSPTSSGTQNTRVLCHLFLEEQNVVGDFDPSSPMNRRVVDIMEDMKKLDLYLTALSLGLFTDVEDKDEKGEKRRQVQIALPPRKGDMGDDGMPRKEKYRWYLSGNENFHDKDPYHIVVATKLCKGFGTVPPEGLGIEDLWERLEEYVPMFIKKRTDEMEEQWKKQEKQKNLYPMVKEALTMRGGDRKKELLLRGCKLDLNIKIRGKLINEKDEKTQYLNGISTAQAQGREMENPEEHEYLKDEIDFIQWMIHRLDDRIRNA